MKEYCAVWLVALVLVICGICVADTAAADNPRESQPILDDLVTTLNATGPNPSLGDHARDVSRLVGTWDVQYTDFSKDGKAIQRTGQFIVGWVLDGRAVQDIWIVNPSGTRKDREVYTDVHYFDQKSKTWRATFVDPENGSIWRFTGGALGDDRFVLETQDVSSSKTNRWSFNDIRSDSFVWRDEVSTDGGKTWKLQSEYHMTRHRPDRAMNRRLTMFGSAFAAVGNAADMCSELPA